MPAYLISEVESVTDPAGFDEYRQRVGATVEAYGGRYVVRGRHVEPLEGDWQPQTLIVIEFDSAERARQWWASEEYRALKAIRHRTAVTKLVIVEGA